MYIYFSFHQQADKRVAWCARQDKHFLDHFWRKASERYSYELAWIVCLDRLIDGTFCCCFVLTWNDMHVISTKPYRTKHDRWYVMSNFCSYSILQRRAEAVGVIQGSRKCEQILFKFVMLAVKLGTAFMPLLAIGCFVLFTGNTYFIE
jgi:hypothetical protein